VPSPIIVAGSGELVRNPITLQDKTKLQCYIETEEGLIKVGLVTYGKVSIVGQKVSVPYVVNYLPLPDFSRYPGGGAFNFNAPETHRGFFLRGPYEPNNDFYTGTWNNTMGRNQVWVTSNAPMTVSTSTTGRTAIANFFRDARIRQKDSRKSQSQKRRIVGLHARLRSTPA